MKVGKALLPFFYGSGSLEAQRHVATLPKSTLRCPIADGSIVDLLITRSYEHMGVRTVANGRMLPEITAKHATDMEVIRRLRGKFFSKTAVPVRKQIGVANTGEGV